MINFELARMLTVALVTTEYVTESTFDGGLANYVHRVALAMARMGNQPVVVVPSDRDEDIVSSGIAVARVRRGMGRPLRALNRLTGGCFGTLIDLADLSWRLNKKVAELHRKRSLSLVHYTHLGGVGLFRMPRMPSVTRLSSYTPLWLRHGGYDDMPRWQVAQQALLERWALTRSDRIFGPSRIIADAVAQEIRRQVSVIVTPFVLDAGEFDRSVYEKRLLNKDYALFFGTLRVAKGVKVIADALPQLLGRRPDLHFVLVGKAQGVVDGKSVVDYLLTKAGPFRDRVVLLEKMRHEQLYPIIKEARVTVLPSLIDNFPNTCLEAMAHRQVVIGTRGTSLAELITDGENGLLCDPGDPLSLTNQIERALRLTPAERFEIGERAAARVHELRPEKVIPELVQFYEDTIAAHGATKRRRAAL